MEKGRRPRQATKEQLLLEDIVKSKKKTVAVLAKKRCANSGRAYRKMSHATRQLLIKSGQAKGKHGRDARLTEAYEYWFTRREEEGMTAGYAARKFGLKPVSLNARIRTERQKLGIEEERRPSKSAAALPASAVLTPSTDTTQQIQVGSEQQDEGLQEYDNLAVQDVAEETGGTYIVYFHDDAAKLGEGSGGLGRILLQVVSSTNFQFEKLLTAARIVLGKARLISTDDESYRPRIIVQEYDESLSVVARTARLNKERGTVEEKAKTLASQLPSAATSSNINGLRPVATTLPILINEGPYPGEFAAPEAKYLIVVDDDPETELAPAVTAHKTCKRRHPKTPAYLHDH